MSHKFNASNDAVELPSPDIVGEYIAHGWHLVPIPPRVKSPNGLGWQKKENTVTDPNQIPAGYGVGLAHAYSSSCAVDIDEWDKASEFLATHGIDLQALYDAHDAVIIDSGRAGHGKLLYAMPFGMALTSKNGLCR
jgi:hypothetical protein